MGRKSAARCVDESHSHLHTRRMCIQWCVSLCSSHTAGAWARRDAHRWGPTLSPFAETEGNGVDLEYVGVCRREGGLTVGAHASPRQSRSAARHGAGSSHERTTRCGSLMGKGSDGGYALRSGATRYGRWHRRRAAGLRHERSSHDAASRGPGSRRPSRVPHRARPRAARPRGNGQCAAARCSAHVNLLNHSGNSNPSIWSYIKR